MALSYREAHTIVALASSMAGAHLGACAARTDRCPSMVTTDSGRRNRVAERQLIEYLDELINPDRIADNPDEFNGWQDLLAVVGLLGAKP